MSNGKPSYDDLVLELVHWKERCQKLEADAIRSCTELSVTDNFMCVKGWRLESIIENIPSAVMLASASGHLIMANRRAMEIHAPGVIGRKLSEHLAGLHARWPDGKPIPPGEMAAAKTLSTGLTIRNQEVLIKPDGKPERTILASSAPIKDEHGQIIAAVIVLEDITALRQLEESFAIARHDWEKQRFLLELVEALRTITAEDDIQAAATQKLGEFLKADHTVYCEVEPDQQQCRIAHGFHRSESPMRIESFRLDSHHLWLADRLRTGKTCIVRDIFSEFDLTDAQKSAHVAQKLVAFVAVPMNKPGKMSGILLVQFNAPHDWSEEEIALIEEVAERTRAAVELAHAETALRQKELLLHTIVQSAAEMLYIKDRDGRVVFANQGVDKMYGIDAEQIIGKTKQEVFGDVEWAKQAFENDQLVMQTGSTHVSEVTRITELGTVTSLLTRSPWRDENGQIIGVVASAVDITARKQAELALKETLAIVERKKRELDAVIASIPDGLMIYDQNINPFYINETGKQLLEKNQIKYGLDFNIRAEEGSFYTEDGRRLKKEEWAIYRTVRNGETIRDFIQMGIGVDGQQHFISASCAPIRDDQGHITGAVGLIKDITEQKRAEQRLRESERRAMDLVEKLQAADRNKSQFISVLSHELRNPLAAIIASLDLIDHIEIHEDQKLRAMGVIRRQSSQLAHLVDDLLDVTRINENKIRLKKEPINLPALVEKIIKDQESAYKLKGVSLSLCRSNEIIELYADPVRLTQAMENLLGNALKFTQGGDHVQVRLIKDEHSQEVIIKVRDTGTGLAPEVLSHLFEPFTQGDQTLARTEGGLGLGLSIVKGMIELHGGRVAAESEGFGKGATFTIYLPIL